MHIVRDNFQFVPMIDYSRKWNDTMLYEYYGLSEEEITYIESRIRAMDGDTNA